MLKIINTEAKVIIFKTNETMKVNTLKETVHYYNTEIFLSLKEKRILREECGVSPATLTRALEGTTDGYGVKLLRRRALELGGVERKIKDHE